MSFADRLRQALNLALIAAGLAFVLSAPEGPTPDQGGLPIATAARSSGVWAVLFACPLGYGLLQARARHRRSRSFRLIGWATALCALLMSLWAWTVQQGGRLVPLALVAAMLATLWWINRRLQRRSNGPWVRWLVQLPWGLQLGWVTTLGVFEVGHAFGAQLGLCASDGSGRCAPMIAPALWAALAATATLGVLLVWLHGSLRLTAPRPALARERRSSQVQGVTGPAPGSGAHAGGLWAEAPPSGRGWR